MSEEEEKNVGKERNAVDCSQQKRDSMEKKYNKINYRTGKSNTECTQPSPITFNPIRKFIGPS